MPPDRRPGCPPWPPRAHPRREEKRREAKRITRQRADGPRFCPAGIPHQNGPIEGSFARQGRPAPTPGEKRSGAKRNASLVSAPVAHAIAQEVFRIKAARSKAALPAKATRATPSVKSSGAKPNASLMSAPMAHAKAQQAFRIKAARSKAASSAKATPRPPQARREAARCETHRSCARLWPTL